jgi:hypothetical protein
MSWVLRIEDAPAKIKSFGQAKTYFRRDIRRRF